MSKGRAVPQRKRMLWIGDAVAHTGFANVTHAVCDNLVRDWDLAVLGVNYFGDPHPYKYPIFPASAGGDIYGMRRLPNLLEQTKPDLVCIINDPWICKDYVSIVKEKNIPLALYMPVDSPNVRADFVKDLNRADVAIGYTDFAVKELLRAGLNIKTAVVPHGLDLTMYGPLPRKEARERIGIPLDWFVVGCVNRNQPRKRLDLAIRYFALWAQDHPDRDKLKLYYHGALQDMGWDILQLAHFYGIDDQLIITSQSITPASGVPQEVMAYIYNCFDIQISTTLGEGWGLTQMEGAGCRVPQIVPDWSALGEWMRDAAYFVPCTSTSTNTGGINTIGGVADEVKFVEALQKLYEDKKLRQEYATKAYQLVSKPQFRWENIAQRFDTIFRELT